ncbi:MAG: GNAT family N-acetyltransferase [Halobacteriales archaeon]
MTSIERGTLDDLADVLDAWVSLAAEQRDHGSTLRADANRDAMREAIGGRLLSGDVVVARDGGDLVGFVSFGVETGDLERTRSRGVVRNIWVRPDRRGEGIGGDLLALAERRLVEAGAEAVALEVMADNDAARRFYRRHGYEPHRVEMMKEGDDGEMMKEGDDGEMMKEGDDGEMASEHDDAEDDAG